MTTATTTAAPNGKPKREPKPMTAARAIETITKLREKHVENINTLAGKKREKEDEILEQLPKADRSRVLAFFGEDE